MNYHHHNHHLHRLQEDDELGRQHRHQQHQQSLPFYEQTYLGVTFSEACGLLLFSSFIILNEGLIRYMDMISENGTGVIPLYVGRPVNGVIFFAALSEIIFGLLGLFLGFIGFIFRYYNTIVVKSCMIIQLILGLYVFLIYIFINPAIRINDLRESPIEHMSLPLYKLLSSLSILTSFHFCFALQGSQFIFMARMISSATNNDFLKQRSGDKMRATFWSMNITFAGLWTLISGSVLASKLGHGKLDVPYVFPPNVGRLPVLTIITGIFMLLFGMAGVIFSIIDTIAPPAYYLTAVFVFLLTWLNFTIGQFSIIAPLAGPVSMHSGLTFMLIFLGTYFVWCYSKDSGFSDDKL